MSLENLCPIKRCLLLLGAIGLLAGAAIGMWLLGLYLLGDSSPLSKPPLDQWLKQRAGLWGHASVGANCHQVSFRINTGSFLLEVQVESRPGWLLACHERWNLSLGTLICRQLGYLQLAHHKGVNLTDVKVNDTQDFVQIVPNQKSIIEDVWQVSYRRPQVSSWLVFAGIIAHVSVPQQAGAAVEKIIYHPRYDDRSHDYDIALMKLTAPLNFSNAIRAVCLPLYHQDFPHGTHCWISGWGYTTPEHGEQLQEMLKEAIVPLISSKKCISSCMYFGELTPRMLCAGYLDGKVDACQADSGGPLVCQDELTWRLVGIVSWGTGCGEPNYPGVYTKVAEFLDWIYQIIELTGCGGRHHLYCTRTDTILHDQSK
uniref:Transmembrane serine protease 5 n=1 Tax=Chelonoidis abingdonii TaxID=106734 RepID=A0A8C0HE61_CHEAB